MSSMLPMAVYALEVPAGTTIPAQVDFPGTIRITMAALDPSAEPDLDAATDAAHPRATLKIIRTPSGEDDDDDYDEDDDDDIAAIRARLGEAVSDEEDEGDGDDEDDEDKNGGPSDPAKSKKARKEAAVKQLIEAMKEDEDMGDEPNGVNGKAVNKGKARATDGDEELEDDEDDDGEEVEEFVICTLDPERHYQQPLDITVGEDEEVYFHVTGTHSIYLTGNYVAPPNDEDDEDEEDYDLSPDEDELDALDEDEEEDELDALEDPRIMEVGTDEDEAPKLVAAKKDKKGKNKRPAEESEEEPGLDDLISKSLKPADATAGAATTNGEQKLSKKQLKKLKKNDGQAAAPAAVPADEKAKKDAEKAPANGSKADKKVQFAKNLEQGPTGSPKVDANKAADKKDDKAKPTTGGMKNIQGVKVEDKKLGSGPAAKKGDRIGMRYIGKLEKDGKVFDANKKGKPFTFKLGAGEVIKGWDIGVAGMAVGGERRITIPANLAYGSKAQAGIPANSSLVFDIKMISLN